MWLDDTGDADDNTGTLTHIKVDRSGYLLRCRLPRVRALRLDLGTGNDTLTVLSTIAGPASPTSITTGNAATTRSFWQTVSGPTDIDLGYGNDTVRVGTPTSGRPRCSAIAALLTLVGGPGPTPSTVVGTGDTARVIGLLTRVTLSGLGMDPERLHRLVKAQTGSRP